MRLALAAAMAIGIMSAQTPSFEVATIKLRKDCGNNGRGMGRGQSPGRLSIDCVSLQDLVQAAYGAFANGPRPSLGRLRIVDAPGWTESDRYDLTAKAADGASLMQMAGPMLQVLLEDRFKLKIRREKREFPVYALTAAKGGVKLQPLQEGSCIPIDLNHLASPPPGQPMPNYCGRQMFRMNGSNAVVDVYGMSVGDFAAGLLSNRLERPVIDRTGLTGIFNFHLEYTPDATMGPVNPNALPTTDIVGPSIFTALEAQLGLKLSADQGPVEVLVIDHVEKPSEN